MLGLPGTNGPNAYEGGTPLFDLDTLRRPRHHRHVHAVLPQRRSVPDGLQRELDQGPAQRPLRHGHLLPGAESHPAGNQRRRQLRRARRLPLPRRPDAAEGRAGRQPLQCLRIIPARPAEPIGRLKLVEPYTTRNKQYSLYIRDQWQADSKLTLSYGTRWEYFPIPTRAHRGLERYNVNTNQMMVGGVGVVPKDLGVEVSKTLFAPRWA